MNWTICTKCKFKFNLDDNMFGKMVCCPRCENMFRGTWDTDVPDTKESSTLLWTACEKCYFKFNLDDDMFGKVIHCPKCRNTFRGGWSIDSTYTITFFGKTGVGKSTTLNKLFGLKLDTDHSIACTREPCVLYLERNKYLELPFEKIRVIDMPGIGESIEADESYLPFYKEWIPKTHTLVWITQADTRAYKRDEMFLTKLSPLFRPSLHFILALNKVDYVGVDENEESFHKGLREPSKAQLKVLTEKMNDVYRIFKDAVNGATPIGKTRVISYTAIHRWGLENLRSMILQNRR